MDRERITEMFGHIVENAVQYSPRGSAVRVQLRALPDAKPGSVECAVLDSGPGFSSEDLNKAFEPFYTRRRGGVGLGLSIVWRILEDHAGKISLFNTDKGGIVKVILPAGEAR
jgi:nitrogen fixation/metabolism regulation signal transduction histidine kinase